MWLPVMLGVSEPVEDAAPVEDCKAVCEGVAVEDCARRCPCWRPTCPPRANQWATALWCCWR